MGMMVTQTEQWLSSLSSLKSMLIAPEEEQTSMYLLAQCSKEIPLVCLWCMGVISFSAFGLPH